MVLKNIHYRKHHTQVQDRYDYHNLEETQHELWKNVKYFRDFWNLVDIIIIIAFFIYRIGG